MAAEQTKLDRDVEALLLSRCRGMTSCGTIEFLISNGLIAPSAAKAFVVRERVAQLQRQGVPKIEAMHLVAEAVNCSYGTVVGYIYR